MLWCKAWLESRARFLMCLVTMTALCAYNVFHGDRQALSYVGLDYYYVVLHGAHSLLATMWVMAVTLLMTGGLLREKALGTSSFTLALPVSRGHLMRVRILFGLAEAIILIIAPWSAMYLVVSLTGKTHSISQACFHVVLLAGGGLVFFSVALLVSSLVEGEYTAPVVSYGIVFAMAVALNGNSLQLYSPWAFIVGAEYFDRKTALLMGPIPWLHVLGFFLIALILTAISIRAIQKREF